MRDVFCCISVLIEDDAAAASWLARFADDTDYLKNSLQMILLDMADTEQSRAACADFAAKYPESAICLAMPGEDLAACYNAAIARRNPGTRYMNYTDLTVELRASDIRKLQKALPDKSVAAIGFSPVAVQPDGKKKRYLPADAAGCRYGAEDFTRFGIYLPGYLLRAGLPREERFDPALPGDWDTVFLLRALAEGGDYFLADVPVICREPFENDFYNYRRQYDPLWYTETLRETYLPLLAEYKESAFVQTFVMYLLKIRFACNRNARTKDLLLGEALDAFLASVRDILRAMDDGVIVRYNINGIKLLPKYMGLVFLRLKYGDPALLPEIVPGEDDRYDAMCGESVVDHSGTLAAAITCMDYDDKAGELRIDARLNNAYVFDYDTIHVVAECGETQIETVRSNVYTLDQYFRITVHREYSFRVSLPYGMLRHNSRIGFRAFRGGYERRLPLQFPKLESRLAGRFRHSYWLFGGFMARYEPHSRSIRLTTRSAAGTLRQELLLYTDYLRVSGGERKRALSSIALRLAYWATRPFYGRRPIWLTFDQLFKGGDNGEYFFRYVADNHAQDVDIYYVANADCADYRRLQGSYRNLLPFNSLKEKLTTLHTRYVFATRVDVKQYCGYGPQLEAYFRGLLNYEVFCLQHGLTIQRIAQYQNRLFDDTRLYFCVSPNEVNNLRHPVYDYDPAALVLTGAPRYDGLISDDKKQILIAPTWRRNVTAGTNRKGHQHEYSINFKDTEYYRIYNGLINNRELIACARETGYRIIYLVHPILSPQVNDFTGPEEVTILAGAGGDVSYERMMCESSLMLTDHSGIQFDFAYMRKPLVYFHPDTLPPQYDEGGMDYETEAFGPVCKNESQVVEALCRAMRNGCRMEPEYRARADRFFAFDDRENCRRVYEAAIRYDRHGLLPAENREG